jgi:hypothetical protein
MNNGSPMKYNELLMMSYLQVISPYIPGGTEKIHENPQP